MEASLLFVGIVGNVISVLVFASPINTFRRIVRNRSTEDFEPSPYVITLLNSSLWVYYGITKPGGLLIVTVNGVGVVMEAVYVALFLLYAAPPLKAKTAVLVAALDVGFFGAVALVTRLAVHGSSRVVVIGLVCAFLNVLMYGSPLCAMRSVITRRSVEYMPFLLSFFLFLNGGIWTLYAILDEDIFIGIPNGIGLILGTSQLILYMIYMNSEASNLSGESYLQSEQQRLIVANNEANIQRLSSP
ncbi:bidirectional sugar transporter SWEET16-like isoform X1 [Musa acuminata AAA Group]|uniref:bidirectional sugar transporter SWEET16-like isoform X1 n=1 Tax=Musa acuminata AAA Group TaxID=214697 RepID=UPI0031D6ED4D